MAGTRRRISPPWAATWAATTSASSAGHPRSQRLGEGLVRHGQVLLAATEEHQRTLLVGPAGERRHQAGLAHARLAADEHRPSLARARRLERGAQPVELGAPADHPFRWGRRQRNRQRRLVRLGELEPDPVGRHRFGKALQAQLADRLERMAASVAGQASAPCR